MKRKMSTLSRLLGMLAVLAVLMPALAMANSATVSYQGVLRTATEVPVVDGAYDMVFSIWDDVAAGTKRWGDEPHNGVVVTNGLFSVYLGESVALGSLFASFSNLYLQVAADTGSGLEVFAPRVPLASVPYAQNAATAANATNADAVNGQTAAALLAEVDNRINAALTKIVPVGTIVGWHKNLSGIPALPGTWVQCSGGTVNDAQSPINNQPIPNLNGGRFLRGSGTSGVFQDDQMQGHIHNTNTVRPNILLGNQQPAPNQGWWAGDVLNRNGGLAQWTQNAGGLQSIFRQDEHNHTITPPVNDGSNGNPRFGSETRPSNMSVTWIMRIK
jgi:hypothetical protein